MLLGEKYATQKSNESVNSSRNSFDNNMTGSAASNGSKLFSQIPADMLDSTYINIQKLKDEKSKVLNNDLTSSVTESGGSISLFNNLLDSNYAYADNTFERTNSMSFFASKLSSIKSGNKESTQNDAICETNEYLVPVDPSIIENVDLIEVNTESANSEQEFSWLCNPMKDMTSEDLIEDLLNNENNTATNNQDTTTTRQTTDADAEYINGVIAPCAIKSLDLNRPDKRAVKPTNPYKWIKEDFEDRDLDKIKRALLCTLDDISKGKNRRSRSVSVTRTPLLQNLEPPQRPAASPRKAHQYQRAMTQNILISPGGRSDTYDDIQQDRINFTSKEDNKENHLNISVARESTESNDDASYQSELVSSIKQQPKVNYSTATIVKRKNNTRIRDMPSTTTESSDQSRSSQQNSYEDFTDVQVIAKMQEESLRQDILNSNKVLASNGPQHIENYYQPEPQQSQADATFKSNLDIKLTDKKKKILPHSSSLTEKFLANKNQRLIESSNQSSNRMFNNDPRYRTITKSSTMTNNMNKVESPIAKSNTFVKNKSQTHMRSITPSSSYQQQSKNLTVNGLPTPRSNRAVDPQNEQGLRPPQAPTAPTQTPSRRTLMPYGAQRSATTSIVPNRPGGKSIYSTSPSPTPKPTYESTPTAPTNQTTSWQKKKITKTKMDQQSVLFQQQQQQQLLQQQQQKFLYSSPNKNTFGSHNNLYASSKVINNLRSNRNASPGANSVNSLSPSGLFTNGPIGRRQARVINASNNNIDSYEEHNGSYSNVTPRATSQTKRSFLPQPVQYNQQQGYHRQTSPSPIRHEFQSQPYSWKDGCY